MIDDISQLSSDEYNNFSDIEYTGNIPSDNQLLTEALESSQDINSSFTKLDNNDYSDDVLKEFGYPIKPTRPSFNNGVKVNLEDSLYQPWQFRLYNIHNLEESIISMVSPLAISETATANYEDLHPLHSPNSTKVYKNSTNKSFSGVTLRFISRDSEEADYVLYAMKLIRSWIKPYFGINTYRHLESKGKQHLFGAPPPILNLSCYGKTHIRDVTVVLTNYSFTWPYDVDYIAASNNEPVPTIFDINLSLEETMSLDKIFEFNIADEKPLELSPSPAKGTFHGNDIETTPIKSYTTSADVYDKIDGMLFNKNNFNISDEGIIEESTDYATNGNSSIYDGGDNTNNNSSIITK